MGFWKSMFGNFNNNSKKDDTNDVIEEQFREWVIHSIDLIGKLGEGMENDELHEILMENGIPDTDTSEILIFLPTAFCRKLLPEINWLPNYIDYYSEEKQIKRKYSENKRYVVIEQETENYWNSNPSSEVVGNIAGRSAEFNAINKMLHDGGELENARVTESYVIRYE